MASFSLESNLAAFKGASAKRKGAFIAQVQQNIDRLNLFWIAKIQREQMNFRKDGPVQSGGTRVQTGMLKRNWFQRAVISGQAVTTKVWSTTKYAPVHEYGGVFRKNSAFGRVTRPYWVHYPKRLRIGESWERDFIPNMRKAIDKAFIQTLGAKA